MTYRSYRRTEIVAGEDSLSLNPRRSRHRDDLVGLRTLYERLSPVVTQVIGMTRAYFDHYDDALADDPAVRAIAEQLRRAGHDARLAVQAGAKLDAGGRLVVDEHQQTSIPGLYAAGDVVRGLNQISTAQGEGAIAATDVHNRLRNKR